MKTKINFTPIPLNDLPSMVGKAIHLSWAYHGTVWILDKVEEDLLYLHTPKTGKKLTASVKDACYTRKYEGVK